MYIEMPFKDKEKAKAYRKKYYQEYYQKNKEKRKEYDRQYRQTEKVKEKKKWDGEWGTKKYRQTYTGLKSHRKSEWKTKNNIIFYDFDDWYDNRFINATHCELCNTEFINKKNVRCCDHDHLSRYNRFVCCNKCNTYVGGIDRKKNILLLELHRYFKRKA